MAKFLFLSDLHCHGYTAFAHTLPNGRNSRLQDCLNIVAQAKQVALEKKCDAVFMLGDVFHARTKIDVDVYAGAYSAFRELGSAIRLYVLVGNHDMYAKSGDVHSLEPFTEFAKVVDEAFEATIAGCRVAAFANHAEAAPLVERFKTLPPGDLLLIHQAMKEGKIGPYGMTGHGELGVQDLPLDRYRMVFAGDYHSRQWVVPDRVHYVGSPLQLNFGEAGEQKCFTYLDTDTWQTEDIPTSAPRFFVFNTPEEFIQAAAAGTVRKELDFVRIVYTETDRDTASAVKTACERVQIVEQSAEKEALQRIGNEIASSDMLLLEAYCQQKAGTLDHDRLVAVGLDELLGDSE